ncbi:hypothetical protein BTA51_29465 [Hahella sp. CCB-MM4]|uniref:type II toxin-antitoxin system YafO family toxin n=1 Tax=Hahella sp. (strain CCB-MM4) TaxID=1926491 RepID=UPI000BC6FAE8|nr:type II toxin-antitoxin system YafO family toxin [Hahella sp. CCB-MM4]OZG69754.1 hypothetical protein BTA51_29465 [Hahella sp. CCB-MM4]
MAVRLFYGKDIELQRHVPAVKKVIDAFEYYVNTGDPGRMFGKDVLTMRPRLAWEEKVKHVHLLDEKRFKIEKLHLRIQDRRTSDSFLLYCPGYLNPDYYMLLTIVWDNGHDFLRTDEKSLQKYAEEAFEFRMKW